MTVLPCFGWNIWILDLPFMVCNQFHKINWNWFREREKYFVAAGDIRNYKVKKQTNHNNEINKGILSHLKTKIQKLLVLLVSLLVNFVQAATRRPVQQISTQRIHSTSSDIYFHPKVTCRGYNPWSRVPCLFLVCTQQCGTY